jgi:Mce-associated membrane protein
MAYRLAVLVAALAVAAAGWFGVSWWTAAQDTGGETRAEVLAAGRGGLVTLNSFDHRDPATGPDRWRDAATGELRSRIERDRDRESKAITAAKTVATATVTDSALTTVDERAGTAEIIAVLDLMVTPDGGQARTMRSRMLADLTRTADGWKLSAVQVLTAGS